MNCVDKARCGLRDNNVMELSCSALSGVSSESESAAPGSRLLPIQSRCTARSSCRRPQYGCNHQRPSTPMSITRSSADADNPARRDVRKIIGSVGLRYIFCNYRKANCTPSTAAGGSACDLTSPATDALFNCSVFNILPSKPHPDYL